MLTLSRKQTLFLLLILLSCLVALAISMTVIHAVNPAMLKHIADGGGDIWSHY